MKTEFMKGIKMGLLLYSLDGWSGKARGRIKAPKQITEIESLFEKNLTNVWRKKIQII